ncbi:MAG TPA: hypothetical protein VM012_13690 [Flavitalea sp.]|nr:hypothetical protein [Flavitalea sp.]
MNAEKDNQKKINTVSADHSTENEIPGTDLPARSINEKGEKYLREVANIEDLPDREDTDDYDSSIKRQKEKSRRTL